MELEEEARAHWEERAIHQATQVTNLAGEAFETLSENRWSRRDCMEYQEELDWAMRTFRRICNEVDTASMSAKMRRMARARLDQVNSEYQRATRVVERLLQAHGGGYREEQKRRGDLRAGRAPDSTPLGGDSGELPRTYSSSSARADYRRRLELNAQESDEDVLFRREMNYPQRGAGGFSGLQQAGAGRAEDLRLCNSRTSQSTRQRPRRAQREAGDDTEATRRTGPVIAARMWLGASTRRIGGLSDAGERIRIHRSGCHPGEGRACSSPGETKGRARMHRRSWDSGWRRSRA
jgi:hypothetical protein